MKPFRQGSRVTFLGDSITAANNYSARIADYYINNLPELNVKFACAGVSGGSVGSAMLYRESDLYSTKPDYVTIMLGVNDSNRGLLEQPEAPERNAKLDDALERYRVNLNKLIDDLLAHGIEVILCTPAPYAEFYVTEQKPLVGGHALILRYAECVRETARERKLEVVDFHSRLSEIYLDEPIYNPDHVHPNDLGHARMCECFLAAQGLPVREWRSGEAPEPISEKLGEWRELVAIIRHIYAVEWMVVRNFGLPLEEKLELVRDYVENKRWGTATYFETISKVYVEHKANEPKIVARINEIMENIYG